MHSLTRCKYQVWLVPRGWPKWQEPLTLPRSSTFGWCTEDGILLANVCLWTRWSSLKETEQGLPAPASCIPWREQRLRTRQAEIQNRSDSWSRRNALIYLVHFMPYSTALSTASPTSGRLPQGGRNWPGFSGALDCHFLIVRTDTSMPAVSLISLRSVKICDDHVFLSWCNIRIFPPS